MLTLKQIRYFIGVAEAGQVSAASANLNISQSAVTLALKDLEAGLGVTLFERRSTGLSLTREGQFFLNHARNIESAVAGAVRSTQTEMTALAGHIRLGLTFTLSGYFLFPILARMRRAYPNITFDLTEASRPDMERLILDGKVDLALLLTSNLSQRRTIASETLVRSKRRLWLASGHRLLEKKRLLISDVAKEPYVLFDADEADVSAQKYWAAARATPNVVFRTNALEGVRSMVANNLAVTILSDMVYRAWSLEGDRIEVKNIDAKIPTMDMGIAWKRGRKLNDVEQLFRSEMRAEATGS